MTSRRKIFLFIALPLVLIFIGLFVYTYRINPRTRDMSASCQGTFGCLEKPDSSSSASCELASPTDVSKVTAILYPGQIRGGDYKPHGGFRIDGPTNAVTVVAPLDAEVVDGSRYIEQGEVQYMFDFKSLCGLEYRLDHLKTLSTKLQAAAETLPAAKVDDSRTSSITGVTVAKGETIATAVGFEKGANGPNVSFDFGVYNPKQKNAASQTEGWTAAHQEDGDQATHAVCWFDLLPAADAAIVKGLPAGDGTSGKTSDYCK